ncbi:MAG: PKD domain-containing protein, partial [Bacteroidia bacterium]|nr:PKD domain-containing protein [Bacteroidia bacterium]
MNSYKSAIIFFYLLIISCYQIFGQISNPSDLSGLYVWLSADSVHLTDNTVDTCFDKNGNNNAIQANVSNKPLWIDSIASLNYQPVIRFDGTDDYLDLMSNPVYNLNSYSLFMVFKYTTAIKYLYDFGTGSNHSVVTDNILEDYDNVGFYYTNDGAYHYTTKIYDNTASPNSRLFANSIPGTGGSYASASNINSKRIGGYYVGGYNFEGDIAEIIIYDTVLSDADRISVEQYLHYKYAPPPVDLGSDIIIPYGFGDTPVSGLQDSITLCNGATVILNTGLGNNYYYLWSDSQTSETISVMDTGFFYVTISDTDSFYIVDSVVITIDSFPDHVSFGSDSLSLCNGNSIALTSGAGEAIIYHWSTEDSTSAIVINSSGDYSVTVTNINGCTGIDTVHIDTLGTAPVPDFTWSPGCTGDTTFFTDSTDGAVSDWLWNFGDGYTDTVQNPVHIYADSGTHVVTLYVENSGCDNSMSQTVTIPLSPFAQFSASSVCISFPYNFVDLSTTAPGDNIIFWLWSFGDDSVSYVQNPQHIYNITGTLNVNLTVNTSNGCHSNIENVITVVDSATSPSPFSLVFPYENALISATSVNFSWNPSANALHYTIQVSENSDFTIIINSAQMITNTNITLSGFTMGQDYYWRVIAYNLCNDSTPSLEYRYFSTFSPVSIPGSLLWLSADQGVVMSGDTVSTWNDLSGSGNHAVQATLDNRPLLVNNCQPINGKPAVFFDGTNDYLDLVSNPLLSLNEYTIFVVLNYESPPVGYLYDFGAGSNHSVATANILQDWQNGFYYTNNNKFHYISKKYNTLDSPNSDLFSNGISSGSGTYSPATDPNSKRIGGYYNGGFGFKGFIAEMIIYDTSLGLQDFNTVEQYLHYKYAPP